jgi:hypothetical protein
MALDNHDFWKSETGMFFARGLARLNRIENAAELRVLAHDFHGGHALTRVMSSRRVQPHLTQSTSREVTWSLEREDHDGHERGRADARQRYESKKQPLIVLHDTHSR